MNWNSDQPKIGHLYNKNWENLFDKPRLKEDNILQFHMDLAASVQKHTENIILYMIDNLYEKTDSENLCISGGVAQNSVINGQILKKSKFKKYILLQLVMMQEPQLDLHYIYIIIF